MTEWHQTQRARARAIFEAGLTAADPERAVDADLTAEAPHRDAWVIAVGKAASRMARAALRHVPDCRGGIVVTNAENAVPVPGAELIIAGHPVPDEGGLRAGKAVETLLARTRQGEQVIALISGGGSALLPAPRDGLTLADKQAVSRLLLGSGADIVRMNIVRQQLSRLKGGGLAACAAPAEVRSLILSDVVGDELSAIASGPTVPPLGTTGDARKILRDLELWGEVPPNVRTVLARERGMDVPKGGIASIIGSNAISVGAMARHASDAIYHRDALEGDVAEAAAWVAALPGPGVHVFGGETTVRLTGTGRGGRNQELALRVAMALEGHTRPWVYLQAGTDGRDGPTDAAGALIDDRALSKIDNPRAYLDNNDAYHALRQADALLKTGGTGTNVADLGVLILG